MQDLVPLTPHACELFKQAFALNTDSPFVFPARRLVPAPLDGNQVSRQFKNTARAIGVPDMRLHDLRHQAATGMAECGVPLEIRQMVQNQVGLFRQHGAKKQATKKADSPAIGHSLGWGQKGEAREASLIVDAAAHLRVIRS